MAQCLFKPEDRVTRKKIGAFRYSTGNGTVKEIRDGNRCYIKWDDKASTGQQHSTVSERFLMKVA